MQKLIMDLRDNTGGYLESAEYTANLFLEKGKLIYSLENSETKADYHDETSACKMCIRDRGYIHQNTRYMFCMDCLLLYFKKC